MSESPAADSPLELARDGDLVWLTLNDPTRANALSPRLIAELTAVYRRDWRAEGVRAVLLRAAGKHFSAGADLEHLRSLRNAGSEENRRDSETLRRLFESVLRQPALTGPPKPPSSTREGYPTRPPWGTWPREVSLSLERPKSRLCSTGYNCCL